MNRLVLVPVAVCLLVLIPRPAPAETVDQKIKRMEAAGAINIITKEKTTDACDKSNDVVFTSTTDGDVVVKPGETKYFKIDKDKDEYTRSGGYYWKCGNSPERSRIKGATYIKVIRKADTGAFDQYWVEIELK